MSLCYSFICLSMVVIIVYISKGIYGQETETVVLNAAFEEIAPCPCDLTFGSCDLGCCCDGECSDNQKATFNSCIPFLPGGQEAETQTYKCGSQHYNKADWFPLTCVAFEYNAFLGYFYDWQYKLGETSQAFLSKMREASFFSYREEETRLVTDTDPAKYFYRYGISVKTGKTVGSTLQKGILTLPQPSMTGTCLTTAPVRYLQNLDTTCTYEISADLCSDSSVLSSLFYIQQSNITGTTTNFFNILGNEADTIVAETNVVYKCVDAAYAEAYLKNTQTLSDFIDPTQTYTFNYALPTNVSCLDECGNDICLDVSAHDPVATPPTLTDCPSQLPPSPSEAVGVCNNAVIDVDYKFTWLASTVIKLDATVILAPISLLNAAGSTNVLSQKYKVSFTHNDTTERSNTTDNFNNVTDAGFARSGKVGYDIGKALHSGSIVQNLTTNPQVFVNINTDPSRQMSVFNPTADGLCQNAGRRALNFGEDVTSRCAVRLSVTDMADCTGLRKLVINRLNAQMPSDVVGRRGNNDATNQAYWVNVIRDDISEQCLSSEFFPRGLSPIDERTGICFNMTTGIHLHVLYGETGQYNGFPIYEVLGSRISYTNTTWTVTCSGLDGGVCNDVNTQPFYLTSSVQFTEIPAQKPTPKSKYFEKPQPVEDKQLCGRDICWDNMFYPFTGRYQSNNREYVFGMVGIIIIFFIGYAIVINPWW